MEDNILDRKNQNNRTEEVFQPLKAEYLEMQMSEEQLKKLRLRMEEAKKDNRKERNKVRVIRFAATAAALIAAFIVLPNTSATVAYAMEQMPVIGQLVKVVTFRDYAYESERHVAKVEVPEIVLEETAEYSDAQQNLEKSVDEINAEIQTITEEIVGHFEAYLEDEEGYQEVIVKSEILTKTEEYFSLKLFCYQGAGSGYQWNYYYTIDLNTGERMQLNDIFVEGADYITLISENIKEQMRAQMAKDEMVHYWLDDEIEELNFKAISEETSFYINEKDNVVISFDQGEVAAMYLGVVEFEIPAEVLVDIRK